MNRRTHINSTLLLIGILLSFSLGVYAELSNFYHEGGFSLSKTHVTAPKQLCCTNDILSEDLENENDELLSVAFLWLPFTQTALRVFFTAGPAYFSAEVRDIPAFIWLSIRVLRI